MACKNATCEYNDDTSPNGCKIFPGESWINCRGASVTPVAAKNTTITKAKGK